MKKELLEEVANLYLLSAIADTEFYLKNINNQIEIYKLEISLLKKTKPCFFQRQKLKKHNQEIDCYEKKLFNLYMKKGDEIDYLLRLKGIMSKESSC